MSILILLIAALGTTLPCIYVSAADRRRPPLSGGAARAAG
jgi:hypothetical protein